MKLSEVCSGNSRDVFQNRGSTVYVDVVDDSNPERKGFRCQNDTLA